MSDDKVHSWNCRALPEAVCKRGWLRRRYLWHNRVDQQGAKLDVGWPVARKGALCPLRATVLPRRQGRPEAAASFWYLSSSLAKIQQVFVVLKHALKDRPRFAGLSAAEDTTDTTRLQGHHVVVVQQYLVSVVVQNEVLQGLPGVGHIISKWSIWIVCLAAS